MEVGTAFRMSEKEAGRNVRAGGRTGRGRKGEGGEKEERDRNREDRERQIVYCCCLIRLTLETF